MIDLIVIKQKISTTRNIVKFHLVDLMYGHDPIDVKIIYFLFDVIAMTMKTFECMTLIMTSNVQIRH